MMHDTHNLVWILWYAIDDSCHCFQIAITTEGVCHKHARCKRTLLLFIVIVECGRPNRQVNAIGCWLTLRIRALRIGRTGTVAGGWAEEKKDKNADTDQGKSFPMMEKPRCNIGSRRIVMVSSSEKRKLFTAIVHGACINGPPICVKKRYRSPSPLL